jgi:hypothetical protein
MAKNKILASLRISDDIHSQLLKTAEEDERPLQSQVRWLISLGLKTRKKLLEPNEEQRRKHVSNFRSKKDIATVP